MLGGLVELQRSLLVRGYAGVLQQLRIVTHLCDEVTLRKTVDAVCKLECVSGEPSILRVLD